MTSVLYRMLYLLPVTPAPYQVGWAAPGLELDEHQLAQLRENQL